MRLVMAVLLLVGMVSLARPDNPPQAPQTLGVLAPINMVPYFSGETMTRWGLLPNVTDEFFGRVQCKGLPQGLYDVDIYIRSATDPNGRVIWVEQQVWVKAGTTLDVLFFLDGPDQFPIDPAGIYYCQPIVSDPTGNAYIGNWRREQTQRQ